MRGGAWPVAGEFRTSSTTWTESPVFEVHLRDGGFVGHGEAEPDEHDPEQWRERAREVEAIRPALEAGCTRDELLHLLPRGPARNAVDSALLDLEAKACGRRAWELVGVEMPDSLETVYTISAGTPAQMATQAREHGLRGQLKLKVDASDPLACVRAVREVAPRSRFLVDANQAWSFELLEAVARGLAELGVELIEQPLPRGEDEVLATYRGAVPLCADESCLDRSSLPEILGRYGVINIKLDKTGGLTEALLLAEAARAEGLGIMVGCNVGTSWAMAPAMIVAASGASFIDLDGPLLLAHDREPGLRYVGDRVEAPAAEVWG